MYEHAMRELQSGQWADLNPFTCPCRSGWLLSDFDTWHRCPVHGHDVPHPEDDSPSAEAFDSVANGLKVCREAYKIFRDVARRDGFKGNFKLACMSRIGDDRSPKAWVNAADEVAEECSREAADQMASRRGFGSALEMRLADEEEFERFENEHGYC